MSRRALLVAVPLLLAGVACTSHAASSTTYSPCKQVSLPTWSPDGTQIVYYGRRWPAPTGHRNPNSILQAYCTMNARRVQPEAARAHGLRFELPRPARPDRLAAGEQDPLPRRRRPDLQPRARRQAEDADDDQRRVLCGQRPEDSDRVRRELWWLRDVLWPGRRHLPRDGAQSRQRRREQVRQHESEPLAQWKAGRLRARPGHRHRQGPRPLDCERERHARPAAPQDRLPAAVVCRPATQIAYRTGTGKTAALHVIPVTGGKSRVLVSKNAVNVFDWSPDGTSIAFESGSTLSIVDVQTREGDGASAAEVPADGRMVGGLEQARRQHRHEAQLQGRPGTVLGDLGRAGRRFHADEDLELQLGRAGSRYFAVLSHGTRDAVGERRCCAPAELAFCSARVDDAALQVARARRGEVRFPVDSRRGGAEAVEVEDARRDSRADVVRAGARLGGAEERGGDVAHVDEVAHLGAVPEDRARLSALRGGRGRWRRRRPRAQGSGAGRRRSRGEGRRGSSRGGGSSRRCTPRPRASRSRTGREASGRAPPSQAPRTPRRSRRRSR